MVVLEQVTVRLQNSVWRGEREFVYNIATVETFPMKLCMLPGSHI